VIFTCSVSSFWPTLARTLKALRCPAPDLRDFNRFSPPLISKLEKCLFCKQKNSIIRRIYSRSRFCSTAHEDAYALDTQRLMLARLMESGATYSKWRETNRSSRYDTTVSVTPPRLLLEAPPPLLGNHVAPTILVASLQPADS
jgi:hypothetical protein